jgi:exodeoxyribonuclease X
MRSYFVADVETTGVRPTDKIVELCFIEINDSFELLSQGESLIDPEIPIPSGASAVHGITNRRVEDEPTIEQYMDMKSNPLMTTHPAVLIAHNAAFDFRYLGPWMQDGSDTLCTLRLAKKIYPGLDSYKLQALKYSLDLPDVEGDAHRAGADVEMLLNLVSHMAISTGLDLQGLLELSKAPLTIEKMAFGKHKDKPLKDVPLDYIQWYMKQDQTDADLVASFKKLHPSL